MKRHLVISLLLSSLLVACASNKPKVPVVDQTPVSSANSNTSDARTTPLKPDSNISNNGANGSVDPLNDPKGKLAGRSVYYPVDVDAVQAADKPLLEAHAKYLAAHPQLRVRLEGNCDERGSNEYNLALGQRRAEGVKKQLILGGAKDAQLSTASFGEEKSRCNDHKESCWSQNRRSDLNYGK